MKKTIWYLSLLYLHPFFLFAQSSSLHQTLKGKIVDAQSGSGLPGAAVILFDSDPQKGILSGEEGYFSFPAVPVGRQTILVTYLGYAPVTVPDILVTSGKEAIIEVRLTEQILQSREVIVRGKKDPDQISNEFGTVSARSFNSELTRRFAGSMNDPARMAANFAGVSGANDARNDIIIRGNSPAGLLWRLEGVDIPNPSHFGSLGATGGPVSMLNNNVLGRSDFFTGAFPAEYGNAMSGVFDLRLRNGNRDKREFTGEIGFNGFEAGAEGPFIQGKRATYLVSYRYSVLALAQKLGLNRGTGTTAPEYQDIAFKIDLPTGKKGSSISVFGMGGLSEVFFKGELKDTANLYNDPYSNLSNTYRMGVAGVSYRHYLNDKTHWQTTLAASGAAVATSIDSLNDERAAVSKYRDASGQGRWTLSSKLNRKINAGNLIAAEIFYHQLYYSLTDSVRTGDVFRIIRDHHGTAALMQGYLQWQWKPDNRLTFNMGFHSSCLSINRNISAEPRAGVKYTTGKRGVISLAAGMHSQTQPLQLYFTRTRLSDGRYAETNRNLSLTRSTQIVAGYDHLFGERVRLKTEVYYQKLKNAPVETAMSSFSGLNLGADFGTSDADSLVSHGTGRNFGLEITLERFFERGYYFLFSNSIFDSKATGSDKIVRNTAFNTRYVSNLLGGKEWKVGGQGTLAVDVKITASGGRPYIPIDPEMSRQKGTEIRNMEKAYLQRYNPYFRADLKVTYRMNQKRFTHEWFIDFQNMTNAENIFQQTYDDRSGKIRTVNQIPFNPNFNYRISF